MAEANTQTITPPATPPAPAADGNNADLFFTERNPVVPPAADPGSVAPGASEAHEAGDKPPAGEKPPAGTEKPEEEADDPTKWFIPGKYKTQEDAIKNQESRMGGIAQQLDQIIKKFDQKPQPGNGDKPTGDINPVTNQPYSQQEIVQQWNDYFQSDPVNAQISWDKMMGERQTETLTKDITNNVIRNITWSAFLSANPEMNSPEKIQEVQTIIQSFPFLSKKPDALLVAKAIALAPGDNLEDKYAAYLLAKKEGKLPTPGANDPAPPQLPGQQAVNKGGPADGKKDSFFNTKSGGSIFSFRT